MNGFWRNVLPWWFSPVAYSCWPAAWLTNGSTGSCWRSCRTGSAHAGSSPWPTRSSCWQRKRSSPTRPIRLLFVGLPLVALAGGLTAALYVPHGGHPACLRFPGRPDRDPVPAQPADPVHGPGWYEHPGPLLDDRGHPHADAGILLRSALPAGLAGPGGYCR